LTLGAGALVLHRPAFTYTRGRVQPRPQTEPATETAALTVGVGVEAIGAQWWGGVDARFLFTLFDEGNGVVASAVVGRVVPRVLRGTLRVGLGPVVVRTQQRPRGLLAGLCLEDCVPVVYPADLTTSGVGLTLVQEWRPWPGVGIGLDAQAASGAQRVAGARVRVALGS
jgi:hypothetical protein